MTGRGTTIEPLAWQDRPALIEVAFPAQKISIEAGADRSRMLRDDRHANVEREQIKRR